MRETYLRLNRAANSDCEFLWSSIFYLCMWISNAFLGHKETKIPVPPNILFLIFWVGSVGSRSSERSEQVRLLIQTHERKILSYKIFSYQRKKYFQVNSQNRPVANLPIFNFRSQPQKMSLSNPLNEQISVFLFEFWFSSPSRKFISWKNRRVSSWMAILITSEKLSHFFTLAVMAFLKAENFFTTAQFMW